MFFLVEVETADGAYRCVVNTSSEYYAERKARVYYKSEGEIVLDATAEVFDTFQHGDPEDYEILT